MARAAAFLGDWLQVRERAHGDMRFRMWACAYPNARARARARRGPQDCVVGDDLAGAKSVLGSGSFNVNNVAGAVRGEI